jgi:hypothetical protein
LVFNFEYNGNNMKTKFFLVSLLPFLLPSLAIAQSHHKLNPSLLYQEIYSGAPVPDDLPTETHVTANSAAITVNRTNIAANGAAVATAQATANAALPATSAGPLATQAGANSAAAIAAGLGYTPYSAANPSSYVNAAGAASAAPVQTVGGNAGTVTNSQLSASVVAALGYTPPNIGTTTGTAYDGALGVAAASAAAAAQTTATGACPKAGCTMTGNLTLTTHVISSSAAAFTGGTWDAGNIGSTTDVSQGNVKQFRSDNAGNQFNLAVSGTDGFAQDSFWERMRWTGAITAGDPSGGGQVSPNKIIFTDNGDVSGADNLAAFESYDIIAGSSDVANAAQRDATESRIAVTGQVGPTPTIGNWTPQALVAEFSYAYATASQGGLGGWIPGELPANGYYRGSLFGGNDNSGLPSAGASDYSLLIGREIDTSVTNSSASVYARNGLLLSTLSSVKQADADDTAIDIVTPASAGAFKTGISFGATLAADYISQAYIQAQNEVYPTYQVTALPVGIDFRDASFSYCAWCSRGSYITGAGAVGIANGLLSPVSTGLSIDVPNQLLTALAISSPGTPTISAGSTTGNWYPGNIFGDGSTYGKYYVVASKVVSAVVNAGGTGGTNGTQTATGTTGTGVYFTASVTVSGGAITAVNSITTAGTYSQPPAILAAEPVTGTGIPTGATLTLGMGAATVAVLNYGTSASPPSNPVTAVSLDGGSGVGLTLTETWAVRNTLTLNSSGGLIALGGHLASSGTSPTTSNGTLSATATDYKGTVTEGTASTGATITFHTAYATAPDCIVTSPTGSALTSYTPSTTTLAIVNASATADKFTYHCIQ